MNIFYLDSSPYDAATYHCDQHFKMLLESAQMLSQVHHLNPKHSWAKLYKFNKSQANNPCTKWAASSLANYFWLCELCFWLNEEYKFRREKTESHKSYREVIRFLAAYPPNIPDIPLTPIYQAMPKEYRKECPVEAYRTYYIKDKLFATYTKRSPPEWLEKQQSIFSQGLTLDHCLFNHKP